MEELKFVDRGETLTEMQEKRTSLSESSTAQSRRNPPARNTSRFWFERFLSVIQRQNPSIVDSAFLGQIAPSNEGKLLAQLKYLHVIDEQGKPTKLLPALNMVGEEQKKAFNEITIESYRDLFSEVKVEKAVPDDILNYFIRRYSFTRDKALYATRFFLYMAEKASIGVSSELSSFLAEKERSSGASSQGALPITSMRLQERRAPATTFSRPSKGYTSKQGGGRTLKNAIGAQRDLQQPISAVVNITLSKDTPGEYWDRVLALLGERRNEEYSEAQTNIHENLEASTSCEVSE